LTSIRTSAASARPTRQWCRRGYIEFADPSPRSFFFEAPSYFLGDLSAYLGGSLRYSQKVSPITPEWRDDPDVVIVGGGLTLVFQNSNSPARTGLSIRSAWRVRVGASGRLVALKRRHCSSRRRWAVSIVCASAGSTSMAWSRRHR
jgi:hypothetical protein